MQVSTAVIPAAGLGTRFLPATKAVPKELFPIGDTPALQLVIEEALGAGIDHIVIVGSRSKPAIEAYFRSDPDLVETLRAAGRHDTAERLAAIGRDWRVTVVHQDAPLGLGHAVGCARAAVGDQPFAVMLPDELMGGSSLLAAMIDVCLDIDGSVVALKQVPADQLNAYGIVQPDSTIAPITTIAGEAIEISDLVEKPRLDAAPSDLAIIGRYVLTPDIFDAIAALRPGSGGELQLTDALLTQATRGRFMGIISTIGRHDTGTPLGFLTAAIELGLDSPALGPDLAQTLARLVDERGLSGA